MAGAGWSGRPRAHTVSWTLCVRRVRPAGGQSKGPAPARGGQVAGGGASAGPGTAWVTHTPAETRPASPGETGSPELGGGRDGAWRQPPAAPREQAWSPVRAASGKSQETEQVATLGPPWTASGWGPGPGRPRRVVGLGWHKAWTRASSGGPTEDERGCRTGGGGLSGTGGGKRPPRPEMEPGFLPRPARQELPREGA